MWRGIACATIYAGIVLNFVIKNETGSLLASLYDTSDIFYSSTLFKLYSCITKISHTKKGLFYFHSSLTTFRVYLTDWLLCNTLSGTGITALGADNTHPFPASIGQYIRPWMGGIRCSFRMSHKWTTNGNQYSVRINVNGRSIAIEVILLCFMVFLGIMNVDRSVFSAAL